MARKRRVAYAQIVEWVLDLPGGQEVMVEEWGHPTLRVGAKMFASGSPDSDTMSVKATKEDQAALIAEDPETFSVAPYVGRYGWVQVNLSRVDADELRELIVEAWRLTAPKKLIKEYEARPAG
jgi:hypothetical protein